MEKNLIKLSNGDLININDILYVHPSKTEESVYLYIKHLYHSSDNEQHVNTVKSKMIKISFEDYDMIRVCCCIEQPNENIMIND